MINRPRRGELISHAGRVNTVIHQVQENNNNRAEAVGGRGLTGCHGDSPGALWPRSWSQATNSKTEEINFLAEKWDDEAGRGIDGTLDKVRNERPKEERQKHR